MSETADGEKVVEVTDSGITVRKSFTADEFPVPAVRFEFESTRDEPATVRLSEDIPESFPMDSVGFHPEYHSENWTAFQDNHVEFSGVVSPDDPLVTVYGVRLDEETEKTDFLTEPTIEGVSTDEDEDEDGDLEDEAEADEEAAGHLDETMIDDIIADDSNQVVKDMLSGEADSVPGLEDEEASEAGDESVEATTEDANEDETAEAEIEDESIDLDFDESESEDATVDNADDADGADDEDTGGFLDEDEGLDLDLGDVDTDPTPVEADEGDDEDAPDIDLGFDGEELPDPADEAEAEDDDAPTIELDLEAAAAETEDSDEAVDDTEEADGPTDDEADELTLEDPSDDDTDGDEDEDEDEDETDMSDEQTSDAATDAQSPPTDAASVGAALAEELRSGELAEDDREAIRSALDVDVDPEPPEATLSGSDAAKIEHLQSRVEELAAYTGALEEFLDENGTGEQLITEFTELVDSFEADLEVVSETVETVDERTENLEAELADTDSAVDDLEADLEDVEDDLERVEGDLEEVESDLQESIDDVESSVEDVQSDVETLEDDLEEVRDEVTDITEWRNQLGSMFSE